jgi:hypothetical protein
MSIDKKLFKITSIMDSMKKDSENPYFKSKYFDVNQLINAVRPDLVQEDLLLLQPIENGCVVTRIIDIESGECRESSLELPDISDPQKIGSAITYYRRYTLQSLLGIEAEDDDGNKANGYSNKPYKSNNQGKSDDDKPWLGEEMKKEWMNAEDAVRDGRVQPKDLREHYKVSKANMAHFERIRKEAMNGVH